MPRWITPRRIDWAFLAIGVVLGVACQLVNSPMLGWIGGGIFGAGIVGLADENPHCSRFRLRLKHPAWFEDWDSKEDAAYDDV